MARAEGLSYLELHKKEENQAPEVSLGVKDQTNLLFFSSWFSFFFLVSTYEDLNSINV